MRIDQKKRGYLKAIRQLSLCCCLIGIGVPVTAPAADNMDRIRSLSRLSGMARFCEHYFFDLGRESDAQRMHRHLWILSENLTPMIRSQEQQSVSERYSSNGYQHYKKYFSTNPRPCENLSNSLSGEGY